MATNPVPSTYEIKKGIPVPGRGGNGKYPFATMEVGDCFDVPVAAGHDIKEVVRNRVSCAANIWTKRDGRGRRFSIRTVDTSTMRVWRVA